MTTNTNILPALIRRHLVYMGCDPEFFLKRGNEIIGAEKVIPKNGLMIARNSSKVVIDGVQAELNPYPSTCREILASNIAQCFSTLDKELSKKINKGITVDFSRAVKVSKTELDSLQDTNKILGCSPSDTIYDIIDKIKVTDVNPLEYLTRSAGGHLHFSFPKNFDGTYSPKVLGVCMEKQHEKTIQMLDIICGNTCVLLDRDIGNIERRKLYGRAGEYRRPSHGLEYRTLSNFWLENYQLLSFVFGIARLAIDLMANAKYRNRYYKAFTSAVDMNNIQKAINDNDFDLAMSNFKAIEKLILEVTDTHRDEFPITKNNIAEFYHFVNKINTEGMTYWFNKDPVEGWKELLTHTKNGFYDFSKTIIQEDMKKLKPLEVPPPKTLTKGKLTITFI